MPYLAIRIPWTHFAPTIESLDVVYDPPETDKLKSVRLEVFDFADTLVYQSNSLSCEEGPARLAWSGEINQGNDANTEPYATPLRSPYTLKVNAIVEPSEALAQPKDLPSSEITAMPKCDEPKKDLKQDLKQEPKPVVIPPPITATVKVLYHSVEIVRGPWLATAEVFPRLSPKSICHKLNQLGYYAGPPARVDTTTDFLDKAKERFRRNHGDIRNIPAPTPKQFEDALDQALGASTARPTLTTDANVEVAVGAALPSDNGAPLRIYVEATGYDEDLVNRTDEFAEQLPRGRFNQNIDWDTLANKTTKDAAKLNRPVVPLEAVIYLKDHANQRANAPRAVGDVKVDWNAVEPGENLDHLPSDDRVFTGTKTYIHRVFQSPRVHLEDDSNTNCPSDYGGIRTAVNNYLNPFWRQAQPYAPYAAPIDGGVSRKLVVPAYTDWAGSQRTVGRAGIYFHPSIIGGDRYQVGAALSFAGRPNAVALNGANAGMVRKTRPIVVWRRAEVFAVIGWPARGRGNLAVSCKERYARAFLELDFGATLFRRMSEVINDQDYADWFNHIRTNSPNTHNYSNLVGVIETTRVDDRGPVILLPNVNPGEDVIPCLFSFLQNMFAEVQTQVNVPSQAGFLLSTIANNIRVGHHCGGLIFLEYQLSDPIRKLVSDFGAAPTTSNGNANLMGIIDQAVNADPEYVFAHEAAHCFWLTHHEASGGSIPQHHDAFDHNCVMSYPDWDKERKQFPHQAPDRYNPTFCGKCNLKLRGWNITHQHLLALDPKTDVDDIKTVFCYDRADPQLRWDEELRTVRGSITKQGRGPFRERFFNHNANFNTWIAELSDCDIYHHVTHGNVRCSRHNVRVASSEYVIPRYPTWCRNDPDKIKSLTERERVICFDKDPPFSATALGKLAEDFISPETWLHDLTGVIQWCMPGINAQDTSRDIEFTYDQIQSALKKGAKTPRRLAFFSSCLIGWDKRFPKLFIDKGTPAVIAFRSRYDSNHALEFSKAFFEMWELLSFSPGGILKSFSGAANQRPHAEPCLFTADKIYRTIPMTMEPGSGDIRSYSWDDAGFHTPFFPKR